MLIDQKVLHVPENMTRPLEDIYNMLQMRTPYTRNVKYMSAYYLGRCVADAAIMISGISGVVRGIAKAAEGITVVGGAAAAGQAVAGTIAISIEGAVVLSVV